ncbi:MAG: DNA recombination protein RmuC [Bacilli bacterium]|jgi:DNA recombination protein RmuC
MNGLNLTNLAVEWPVYLIFGILLVLIVGGFAFILVKMPKAGPGTLRNEDYEKLGKLETKMDALEKNLPDKVKMTIGEAQQEYLTRQVTAQTEYLANQVSVQKSLLDQLNSQFKSISDNVASRLEAGFKTTNETVTEVNKQLGSIAKTQDALAAVSGEVTSLRRVLEGNQSRGQFGEYTLETIVRSVFGEEVKDVYDFQKNLDNPYQKTIRPDVTIYLPEPEKHLCIDSKFPFRSYQELFESGQNDKVLLNKFKNELLLHVRKIKDDYIMPGVTAPYALLFIPSDGIFTFVHVHLFDVVESAYRANVIIVSPSTLQPILATVNLLRLDRKRAESVAELNEKIKKLAVQFSKFDDEWEKLAGNLRKTLNSVDEIDARARGLSRAFISIQRIEDDKEIKETGSHIEMNE